MPEQHLMSVELAGGLSHYDALSLRLGDVVGALGMTGAMMHAGGPGIGHLYLAASSGLGKSLAEQWKEIGWEEQVPPALAARDNTYVWMPGAGAPGLMGGRPARAAAGTGMAAVPVPAPEGPLGVLSVFTAAPGGLDAEERSLLAATAERISEGLPWARAAPRTSTTVPGKTSGIGTWEWDFASGTVEWDRLALTVLGVDADTLGSTVESWMDIVHPDDLTQVIATSEQAIRTRRAFGLEYRVRRPDGSLRWVEARGHVLPDDSDRPCRVIGTLRDITDDRLAEHLVGRALQHMSDGLLTVGTNWRIAFANTAAEHLLGPSGELIGQVPWKALSGIDPRRLEAACRRAVLEDRPTGLDARLAARQRWHHLRLVPIPDGLIIYLTDVHDARQREAEQSAAEHAAAERSARIGELTGALAVAVTTTDVVDAVADHVLPLFGAVGLNVFTQEAERLVIAGAVGYPQTFLDRVNGLPVQASTPVSQSLLSRSPIFVPSQEEFLRRYPELADFPAEGEKQAWAFLPLIASGQPIGACVVSFDRPQAFTSEERTLFTAVSGLFAQALARARLYDTEHTRAQTLQRGLLPRALPDLPAMTAAARYLPATAGLEIGGDWYDVIPLSGERVALVIGDVMGHGLSEAATMGRLRTAVHTLADLDLPPGEVLSHLNDTVSSLGDEFYATCLYAVYDPTSAVCTVANAGHPAPAVVLPDGAVRFLDVPINAPLGAGVPPFDAGTLELPDDSLLVLYTDGLVESSALDIDQGRARLAQQLAHALPLPPRHPGGKVFRTSGPSGPGGTGWLERLCDVLVHNLLPAQQQTIDDTALLIAAPHPLAPGDIASWPLPHEPEAAGQARGHVRDQLAAWGLEGLTDTTELLVSELVGNVVRHAEGPTALRMLRSRTLVCEVSDGSSSTPRIRRAAETDEGGRGLQLVATLAQRWGARYTATGKCIWTEQPLPERHEDTR
ncbi:SpoIIE family protein phosphatase [Streptomyces shenzhenensis]|uniref:SpoIIE family protein phosphatase n=1 Tax=Streptomyces shenzhenensis TaxID=943815 RepID=UPI0028682D5A|nr:SpoIIE family protein phosphatase [Streptomyces shenzhenensis]